MYDNLLIAAGSFAAAGGSPANNLASWNGASWSALGSGTNNSASALTVFEDRLLVGGEFMIAGGKVSVYLAMWDTDPTGIGGDQTPTCSFALSQNYPNPFNPTTVISFTLPERMAVTLSIYDVQGRLVRVLADGTLAAGHQQRVWDGKDTGGTAVGSGVYFYRLTAGSFIESKKMVLLK